MRKADYGNVYDFEKLLTKNGLSPEKFWKLPEQKRNSILAEYTSCYVQEVSNRKFNPAVYKEVKAKKLSRFIQRLKDYKTIQK